MARFKWSKTETHRRAQSYGVEPLDDVSVAQEAKLSQQHVLMKGAYGDPSSSSVRAQEAKRSQARRAKKRSAEHVVSASPAAQSAAARQKKPPLPTDLALCRVELAAADTEMAQIVQEIRSLEVRYLVLRERSKQLKAKLVEEAGPGTATHPPKLVKAADAKPSSKPNRRHGRLVKSSGQTSA